MPAPAHGSPESCSLQSTSRLPSWDRWRTGAGPSDGGCCHTTDQRNAPTYLSLVFTRVDLTSSGGLHGLGLLVGIGAAALLLIAVRALTVAASDDADATEAVVESFKLGETPAKRKG